jgi:hypothetical protein
MARDAARFVDGGTDDREVESILAADVAVEHLADTLVERGYLDRLQIRLEVDRRIGLLVAIGEFCWAFRCQGCEAVDPQIPICFGQYQEVSSLADNLRYACFTQANAVFRWTVEIPARLVAHQPLRLRNVPTGHRIARGVPVVAPTNLDEIVQSGQNQRFAGQA